MATACKAALDDARVGHQHQYAATPHAGQHTFDVRRL
jgi:hypothetical protein